MYSVGRVSGDDFIMITQNVSNALRKLSAVLGAYISLLSNFRFGIASEQLEFG